MCNKNEYKTTKDKKGLKNVFKYQSKQWNPVSNTLLRK